MASLYIAKYYQFSTDAGDPLNGGKLSFSLTTTTTNKNTYPTEADAIAGTNANVNPIILDTDGRSPVEVWISGRYRLRVYTSADVLISDDDPIEDTVGGSASQSNSSIYGGNNTGTNNALVFNFLPPIGAYTDGQSLSGRIIADNSGAVTINAGAGVVSLVKRDGSALISGDLQAPDIIEFAYDETSNVFRLLSPATSAEALDANGNAPMRQGLHTIPYLASAMISRTTNGAAVGQVELPTNKVMILSKDFDQTTSEGVQFYVPMPKSWNEGTLTACFGWTAASGTGMVTWSISAAARSDDDALDAAFGTAVPVTDTLLTANDMHISPTTAAITVGGTPAENDLVLFQITRDIVDTLNADACLMWAKIFISYNAGNDQ